MREFLKTIDNQDGSIMIIALMVLAIMTVIGIMSANTTISENFIIRNTAFQKQNVRLLEAAVMEGLQEIMQCSYPDETRAQLSESQAGMGSGDDVSLWLNSDNDNQYWNHSSNNLDSDWYAASDANWMEFTERVLDPTEASLNLKVPDMAASGGYESAMLASRGEIGSNNVQMAFLGWEPATSTGGTSLRATGPVRRSGRILAEYVSANYGMARLEIGVEQVF